MPKNIHIVIPGHYLHFPPDVDELRSCWLRPGGVLDLGDPYIAHAVKGQEYKLTPAGEGDPTEPDPITSQRMRIVRDQFMGTYVPPKTEAELARERAAGGAEAEGLTANTSEPDLTPKRSNRRNTK